MRKRHERKHALKDEVESRTNRTFCLYHAHEYWRHILFVCQDILQLCGGRRRQWSYKQLTKKNNLAR